MADKEQRTEEATPRKKDKLREDGKVAKSQDVGAVAVIFAVAATLAFAHGAITAPLTAFARRSFRLEDAGDPLTAISTMLAVLRPAAVPLATAMAVAAAVGVAQSRVFSLSLVALKPERLDPSSQLKRILPGKDAILEVVKQSLKITAIGFVVYRLVASATPTFTAIAAEEPSVGAVIVGKVALRIALYGGAAFGVVAAFDYWLARRRFNDEAKMSRQDIRDEHKEVEGSPEVRQRMRKRMREMIQQRTLSRIEDATVMVTNPTHFAVALRYEVDRDAAPIVLAKGADEAALRMRIAARKHRVPIMENRPLARALHAGGKIGRPIPVELYRATAEIIARVMSLGSEGQAGSAQVPR